MKREVPLNEKYALTIPEASKYFNIGEKSLRRLISENMSGDFIMTVGSHVKIKRRLFEDYLDKITAI